MSDERTRELERRWRATGSVEDEARLLQERVREGDLPRASLQLAARCGHPAALLVAGETGAGWLSGERLPLEASDEVLVRIALAALRAATSQGSWRFLRRAALNNLGDRRDPASCEAAARALRSGLPAPQIATTGMMDDDDVEHAHEQWRAAYGRRLEHPERFLEALTAEDRAQRLLDLIGALIDYPRARAFVEAQVPPWLLGYGDPLERLGPARGASPAQIGDVIARALRKRGR